MKPTLDSTVNEAQFLLDWSQQPAVLHDREGRILNLNEAFLSSSKHEKEKLLDGFQITDLLTVINPSDDDPSWQSLEPGDLQKQDASLHRNGMSNLSVQVNRACLREEDKRLYIVQVKPLDPPDRPFEPFHSFSTLFRTLAEATDELIWVVTRDFSDLVFVNSAYEQILGRSIRALYEDPMDFMKAVHPDDRSRVHDAIAKVLDGESVEIELRTYEQEDFSRWVLARSVPIYADQDEVQYIAGFTRDITDRKETRNELKRQKEWFETLFERSGEGTMIHDARGNFVDVNQPVTEKLGYDKETVIDQLNIWDIEVAFTREELLEICEEMSPGERRTIEGRHRRADGSDFPVEVRVVCFESGDQKLFMTRARDITERKERERDLRQFRKAVESAGHSIYFTDREGTIEYVNPAFEEITGYSAEEAVGNTPRILQSGEHDPGFYENLWETIQSGDVWRNEIRNETKSGDELIVDQTIAPLVGDNGEIERYVVVNADITRRKQIQEELQESEHRFRQIAENIDEIFWLSTVDKEVLYMSPSFEEVWGRPRESVYEDIEVWFEAVHPEDRARVREAITTRQTLGEYDEEYRIVRPDGEIRWIQDRAFPVTNEEGNVYRIAGVAEDITERKELEHQLKEQALHDELTGLPNRRLLMDRLQVQNRRAQRDPDRQYALLYMDVDNLKMINDTLGHSAGDRFLQVISERLDQITRTPDTLARVGGDEFVLLVGDLQESRNVNSVLDRIKSHLDSPVSIENQAVTVSMSIGVARCQGIDEPDKRLNQADQAMQEAKQKAGISVEEAPQSGNEPEAVHPDLLLILPRALENDELTMHYQPIVDIKRRQLAGLEALIRWNHPDEGLLTAGRFVKQVEQTSLMKKIGHYVFEQVENDYRSILGELMEDTHGRIHVNLSARRMFAEELTDELTPNGLRPDVLSLELTETALLSQQQKARDQLKHLRGVGFDIYLDDFGTGYSSLSHLHQWPVDGIKIDRSFVRDFEEYSTRKSLVHSILALGNELDLTVVAEGIESEETRNSLTEAGCNYAQGFHLGKPERPEHLLEHIDEYT